MARKKRAKTTKASPPKNIAFQRSVDGGDTWIGTSEEWVRRTYYEFSNKPSELGRKRSVTAFINKLKTNVEEPTQLSPNSTYLVRTITY